MTHSGATAVDNTFDEYADTSCYMGYSVDDGQNDQYDEQKCFNAAKMVELGWYSSSNIYSIQPSNNEEFNGNVIGVADYGISGISYTLSLEIKNPLTSNVHSFFLTYNKAKGINEDTHSGPNEVRIVQGAPGEQSSLIASISQSSSFSVPDYYNGRSLDITVGTEAVNAGVNFVPVSVSQEI